METVIVRRHSKQMHCIISLLFSRTFILLISVQISLVTGIVHLTV